MTEKVVILNSEDPDETHSDKTSNMGVQCMNAVVISLGIIYLCILFKRYTESFFGQNRKISILLGPR